MTVQATPFREIASGLKEFVAECTTIPKEEVLPP